MKYFNNFNNFNTHLNEELDRKALKAKKVKKKQEEAKIKSDRTSFAKEYKAILKYGATAIRKNVFDDEEKQKVVDETNNIIKKYSNVAPKSSEELDKYFHFLKDNQKKAKRNEVNDYIKGTIKFATLGAPATKRVEKTVGGKVDQSTEKEVEKPIDNITKLGNNIIRNNNAPFLEKGIESDYVSLLTSLLKKKGLDINVTNTFDDNVKTSVVTFQSKSGLDKDGKVGKKTWSKLLGKTIDDGERLPGYEKGWNTKTTSSDDSGKELGQETTNVSSKEDLIKKLKNIDSESVTMTADEIKLFLKESIINEELLFKFTDDYKILAYDSETKKQIEKGSFTWDIDGNEVTIKEPNPGTITNHIANSLGENDTPVDDVESGDIEITWKDEEDQTIKVENGYLDSDTAYKSISGFNNGLVDALDYYNEPDLDDSEEALSNLEQIKNVKFKIKDLEVVIKNNRSTQKNQDTNLVNALQNNKESLGEEMKMIDFLKMVYNEDESDEMEVELRQLQGDAPKDKKEDFKKVINSILTILGYQIIE